MSSPLEAFLTTLASPWPRAAATDIVRVLRHAGLVEESIKWGNPFFSLDGHAIVKIFVARDWINVYFYRGSELADPHHLLAPQVNSTMTKLRVARDEQVPAGLRELMVEAMKLEHR